MRSFAVTGDTEFINNYFTEVDVSRRREKAIEFLSRFTDWYTYEHRVLGYIKGKLLQTVFSFLLSCIVVIRQGWIPGLLIPFIMIFFRKVQNKYGNPRTFPV